jgi:nicotinate phosphoribosyltransferase
MEDKRMGIILSLLDQDFYKFSMQGAVLHQFASTNVRYEFKCRNGNVFDQRMVNRINQEITHLCDLTFKQDEIDYLNSIRFLKRDYTDFLKNLRLNRDHITCHLTPDGRLEIVAEGNWFLTILFEVPVLAIVNQVYFENTVVDVDVGRKRLKEKIALANDIPGFHFSDFGTRRRFSFDWQKQVFETLFINCPQCIGTSNVFFAKEYGVTPIGTMAHEFIMAGQGLDVTLRNSQAHMLQAWVDEYRGDLGYALSDTLGIDAFLRDFDLYFAKLYDGLRHDSGDPFEWGDKVIRHYESLKIDPRTKQLIFSDGLDMPKAVEIFKYFEGRAKTSFGIGTNLTNDILGATPLNIVMKLTQVNGKPVAKISDSKGKGMCSDEQFLSYLKTVFGIKE